jgi:hypothetical protein
MLLDGSLIVGYSTEIGCSLPSKIPNGFYRKAAGCEPEAVKLDLFPVKIESFADEEGIIPYLHIGTGWHILSNQ